MHFVKMMKNKRHKESYFDTILYDGCSSFNEDCAILCKEMGTNLEKECLKAFLL